MFNELVSKGKAGDKSSMEEIINRLQPLIYSSIRKYYYNKVDYEDLVQEGNLTIMDCIYNFDFNRNVNFLGYIKSQLRYLYLNKHREKTYISLNQPIKDEEGEMIDLLESEEEDSLEKFIKNETLQELRLAIEILTPRQREIVILYYFKAMSISDIGHLLGISYRTVVNTKTNAIESLKNILKI